MTDKIEYPSIPEMGGNLAKFAFDIIKKSMKGDALIVSNEVAEERMDICKGCEYYDSEKNRCKHCGCFLDHKVRWALDSCPIGKWTSSDKDWIDGGKFDKILNHIQTGTEPLAAGQLDHGDIPDFPDSENIPIGFVYVYKNTEWLFTGESWIPYDSSVDPDIILQRELDQKRS